MQSPAFLHLTVALVLFIISDVIYVIGGYSNGDILNFLQSYNMNTQVWTTLPPMKEKRGNHAVCLQGDQIIVAGGSNRLKYLATCEAFHIKSNRFV